MIFILNHFIVVKIFNDKVDGIDDGIFSQFVRLPRGMSNLEDWSLFWHALSELLKRCAEHGILIPYQLVR